jgi:hypothetical protein
VGDPARLTTKDWSVKYLLSGIGRCGECPTTPHLRTVKQRYDTRAYQCSEKFHTTMRMELLDSYVEEALLEWLRTRAADAFRTDEQQVRAAKARVRLKALERQLEEAREKAETFDEETGEPKLSLESFARQEAKLLPMIKKAKQDTEVVEAPPLVRGLIAADDVEDRWEALTIEQQRTVVRACVNVRLNRARARGVRSIEPGRITLVFAGEEGFRALPRHARATARGQEPASAAAGPSGT